MGAEENYLRAGLAYLRSEIYEGVCALKTYTHEFLDEGLVPFR